MKVAMVLLDEVDHGSGPGAFLTVRQATLVNLVCKGKPSAARTGSFFGETKAFKTSSPDVANGGGMATETDVQSRQVARGLNTDPNDYGSFLSFLEQSSDARIVDTTETDVQSSNSLAKTWQVLSN